MFIGILLLLLKVKHGGTEFEGYIIGGKYTHVGEYPHSAFLEIVTDEAAICGSSILNQNFLVTAAHCLEDFKYGKNNKIVIKYGSENVKHAHNVEMKYYKMHENYDQFKLINDIGLIRSTTKMRLSNTVKRVAIMQSPPKQNDAYVAGWGIMNERQDLPKSLKATKQRIQTPNVCSRLGSIPRGSFCAGPIEGPGHPDVGDSGSGLIINNYILIGLVSYKVPAYSLVVYSNVSYFQSWIRRTTAYLYCRL